MSKSIYETIEITEDNFQDAFESYAYNEAFMRTAMKIRFVDFEGHEEITVHDISHIAMIVENIRRNSYLFRTAATGYNDRFRKLLSENNLIIDEDDVHGSLYMFKVSNAIGTRVIFPKRDPKVKEELSEDIRKTILHCYTCGSPRNENTQRCPYCSTIYSLFRTADES